MTIDEDELKRIHGDDVELKPDNSEDDNLAEEDALQEAADQGIYFKDSFLIVSVIGFKPLDNVAYDNREDAEQALSKLSDPDQYAISQHRERLSSEPS